jgi:hypothetical protein
MSRDHRRHAMLRCATPTTTGVPGFLTLAMVSNSASWNAGLQSSCMNSKCRMMQDACMTQRCHSHQSCIMTNRVHDARQNAADHPAD